MELKEFVEELSTSALPPVTASRTHTRPVELSSRPAWFEDVVEAPASNGAAKRRSNTSKPAQDEWGMFDPDQCGAKALFEKLDAIAEIEQTK